MDTKRVNVLHEFLIGTLLIALGIFILNTGIFTLQAVFYIFGVGFIGVGISSLFRLILNKIRGKAAATPVYIAILNIGVGIVTLSFPTMPIWLFGIVCGIYALAIGIVHAARYIMSRRNGDGSRFRSVFLCLFYLVFGGFLLFSPRLHVNVVLNVIAVYFILYGVIYYKDVLVEIIPLRHKNKIKRKIRIPLPVLIEALTPKAVLDEVNKYLTPSSEKEIDAIPDFKQLKSDQVPDVEIFIHASPKGFGMVGHVDICLDGNIISYGNYDSTSVRLFETVGDGVLFVANKEEYIPFVIKDSDKTLFSFGLKLDDEQKKEILERLYDIKENLCKWTPPAFVGKDDPYAARLNNSVEAKFYKFEKGKFKTYFVLGSNCVLLADRVIGNAGIDLIRMNGIITPGSYYDYLNTEFASSRMLVISKEIYN